MFEEKPETYSIPSAHLKNEKIGVQLTFWSSFHTPILKGGYIGDVPLCNYNLKQIVGHTVGSVQKENQNQKLLWEEENLIQTPKIEE